MAIVIVNFTAPGGYQFSEQREAEPVLGEVVMIGSDPFVVRFVMSPDYWNSCGDVRQYRLAFAFVAYLPSEAA